MARVIPNLDSFALGRLKSRAEATVYKRCCELENNAIVLFSVPWIRVRPYGKPFDGETDFVLFHPTKGILVIEVKGGGIGINPVNGIWTSQDRFGKSHEIKDPFKQAVNSKYAIKSVLTEDDEWSRLKLRLVIGHAVIFPDLTGKASFIGTDRPEAIVGCRDDLEDFQKWVDSVFNFWSDGQEEGGNAAIDKTGMHVIERLFFKEIEVSPLLSTQLADEEIERIKLTQEQALILSALRKKKRAAISGGAGTGKTLLALNKAKQLGAEGLKTLLLCFNQPLGDQLIRMTESDELVDAMSFHQLCSWFIRIAKSKTGQDFLSKVSGENPNEDKFGFWFPLALAEAVEHTGIVYDAIVIDEAQDFRDEYWLPIDVILDDDPNKILYIFYDHNQRFYELSSLFPIDGEPFLLSKNCRNTKIIHDLAYQFYQGELTEPSPIPGYDIDFIDAPSRAAQANKLHSHLVSLLSSENVSPHDISVLVPSQHSSEFISLLINKTLPGTINWAPQQFGSDNAICIETMMRFKGLEASYIYVWGADELDADANHDLLYVTFSRAKSRIWMVGNEKICRGFLPEGN